MLSKYRAGCVGTTSQVGPSVYPQPSIVQRTRQNMQSVGVEMRRTGLFIEKDHLVRSRTDDFSARPHWTLKLCRVCIELLTWESPAQQVRRLLEALRAPWVGPSALDLQSIRDLPTVQAPPTSASDAGELPPAPPWDGTNDRRNFLRDGASLSGGTTTALPDEPELYRTRPGTVTMEGTVVVGACTMRGSVAASVAPSLISIAAAAARELMRRQSGAYPGRSSFARRATSS